MARFVKRYFVVQLQTTGDANYLPDRWYDWSYFENLANAEEQCKVLTEAKPGCHWRVIQRERENAWQL